MVGTTSSLLPQRAASPGAVCRSARLARIASFANIIDALLTCVPARPIHLSLRDATSFFSVIEGNDAFDIAAITPTRPSPEQILLVRWSRKLGILLSTLGERVPLEEVAEISDVGAWQPSELVTLDDALTRMAEMDPRKAKVIEFRFFGGLSVEEIADVLTISPDVDSFC